MHHYLEVALEALVETSKVLPLLFIVYYLIELFEFKCAVKLQNNKWLKGNLSPVMGSLIGSIPQCGFSVISSDLFSRRLISVGALIAVYIATSDEAIPIMIANPKSIPWMLLLIVVKIVLGIVIGYLAVLFYKLIFKKKHLELEHNSHHGEHDHDHENEGVSATHGGCCNHSVESTTFDWKHPLLHCLKISAFILIMNLLFGMITHIWVGEDVMSDFLNSSILFQPILAVLIGLIPNCASSVVLTELFVSGGLKFGALVAGLCINAGLGFVMLLKQNKNWKENLFILAMMIIPSLIVGYSMLFI